MENPKITLMILGVAPFQETYIYVTTGQENSWTPVVRERPMNCDCWTPSLPTAAPGIALALEVMGPASALSARAGGLLGAGAVNLVEM